MKKLNKITIGNLEFLVAQDYIVNEGKEKWIGEYWLLKNGACIQIFQEPVHGYYIKIEKRSLKEDG